MCPPWHPVDVDDGRAVVFISSRRSNSNHGATAILGHLKHQLTPHAEVFWDTDTVDRAADWLETVQDRLRRTVALIVVMAEGWHAVQQEGSGIRRIDEEDDSVRNEIATALKEHKPIFPVLLDGATLPPAEWLPEDIRGLCNAEVHAVRSDNLETDLTSVVEAIARRKGWSLSDLRTPHTSPTLPRIRTRIFGTRRLPSVAFVGRDAVLHRLHDLLVHQGANARISASVAGLAGVGKTELALQLTERLATARAFAGGIYWLDAEDPDLTLQWGGAIADQHETTSDNLPPSRRASMVIREIERRADPVLLVLDNVTEWTPEQKPKPLPDGAHVRLLMTTRQQYLGGSAFEHVHLGVLENSAARALLETIANRGPIDDADPLLEHLDGHALGIELAGVYLRRYRHQSAGDYLERLIAGELSEREAKVAASVRYQNTVQAALSAVWNEVDVRTREAWLIAACFEDGPATCALADAAGLDEDARADLEAWHLLNPEDGDRWTQHRLVRAFGRRAGESVTRQLAENRFLEACTGQAQLMDFHLGFQQYQANQLHFDRAIQLVTSDPSKSKDWATLLDGIARAKSSLGNFEEAKTLLELALASDLQKHGPNHSNVATRQSHLGRVLGAMGNTVSAKVLLEQALTAALNIHGQDTALVASIRNNLGLFLLQLGDLAQAKTLFEEALTFNLRHYGAEHPEVARSRDHLGRTLFHLRDVEGAKMLHEQALASDTRTYGPDHPEVAIRRNNLAWALMDLGQLETAKALMEQSLESDVNTYGPDHITVAVGRSNLGMLLGRMGDIETSRRLHELALNSALKTYGSEDTIHVAIIQFKWGQVLADDGDFEEAKTLFLKALTVFTNTYGRLHWRTEDARSAYDSTLRALAEPSQDHGASSAMNKEETRAQNGRLEATLSAISRHDVQGPTESDLLALQQLLVNLFTLPELRGLINYMPGGLTLTANLPELGASLADYCTGVVTSLRKRGALNGDFFDRLRKARPLRAKDINEVAARFGS